MAKKKTVTLWLVQAGATSWADERRLHGAADLPLSDAGRSTVLADIAHLAGRRISVIHHPADEAASETARLVGGACRSKMREASDLADPDLGLLEGMTEAEFAERFPKRSRQWQEDVLQLTPPDGEAVAEARERILTRLGGILRRTRATDVGIVLHRLGAGLLTCWLAERPSSDVWEMLENTARIQQYLMTSEVIARLGDR